MKEKCVKNIVGRQRNQLMVFPGFYCKQTMLMLLVLHTHTDTHTYIHAHFPHGSEISKNKRKLPSVTFFSLFFSDDFSYVNSFTKALYYFYFMAYRLRSPINLEQFHSIFCFLMPSIY